MKISKYRKHQLQKEKQAASALHREGLSYRDIGILLGKSHEWVRQAVEAIDGVEKHNWHKLTDRIQYQYHLKWWSQGERQTPFRSRLELRLALASSLESLATARILNKAGLSQETPAILIY